MISGPDLLFSFTMVGTLKSFVFVLEIRWRILAQTPPNEAVKWIDFLSIAHWQ